MEGIKAAVTVGLRGEDRGKFHERSEDEYQALFAELGDMPDGTVLTRIRGSVGSLFIGGPIVPRCGALLESSGIVSVNRVTKELRALEQDSSIDTIVIVSDSPGGAVTGIAELSAAIKACNKRVVAYVYGMGASAAYWIICGADKIVASPAALVGSIGVLSEVRVAEDDKFVTLKNTQSPKKGLDGTTEEGRLGIVRVLSDLAEVFIGDVAANRGVTAEAVESDFGQGAVMIASKAKKAGMIDEVGTLAATMAGLENKTQPLTVAAVPQEERSEMTLHELMAQDPAVKAEIDAMVKAARDEGAAAVRAEVAEQEKARAKLLEDAHAILASNAYEKIHHMAMGAIKGSVSHETLTAVQIAFDSFSAEEEEDEVVADGVSQPVITPAEPPVASADGNLGSVEDIEAEILESKGV